LEVLLVPIRERRRYYEDRHQRVQEIIMAGTEKAKAAAGETMEEIRAAMRIDYRRIDSGVK
jgi:tryptophanyl-tRNA synthetase